MPARFPLILTVLVAGVLTVLVAGVAAPVQHGGKLSGLVDDSTPIALRLEAPLQQLFAAAAKSKAGDDEKVSVPGRLTYRDPQTGADVVLPDVAVSVRGHTSRDEAECTFPKLKLKMTRGGSIRLGTHCGDAPDDHLSRKYGRLTNDKSPHREALAYHILAALGVPTLRARGARVTYVDTAAAGEPIVRNALLVEEDHDAVARLGGGETIPLERFGNVKARGAEEDAGRIAFGEAAIGNFDWCLKFSPDDSYRCDDSKPLWNLLAFDRGGGRAGLLMEDFDLAGVVVGRHPWFSRVFNPAFVRTGSEIDTEVGSQVQRARSLYPRATLDALRRGFVDRKAEAYDAVDRADVDPQGRQIARAYLDAFFQAIGSDDAFYLPVVARPDVRVYSDPDRTKEACEAGDAAPVGTPVKPLQQSGSMSQVVLLDALWRWGTKTPCPAILQGPVWMRSDAMTSQFPPRSR